MAISSSSAVFMASPSPRRMIQAGRSSLLSCHGKWGYKESPAEGCYMDGNSDPVCWEVRSDIRPDWQHTEQEELDAYTAYRASCLAKQSVFEKDLQMIEENTQAETPDAPDGPSRRSTRKRRRSGVTSSCLPPPNII